MERGERNKRTIRLRIVSLMSIVTVLQCTIKQVATLSFKMKT